VIQMMVNLPSAAQLSPHKRDLRLCVPASRRVCLFVEAALYPPTSAMIKTISQAFNNT
jgi:hypothetical protein